MRDNLEPVIRNAVRAVIVRGHRLLLLRKDGGGRGERYALPGGAQDPGETLHAALRRECREEIGTEVQINDLLHLADYFKPRGTIPPSTRHVVEFLFACTIPDDYRPINGARPDRYQLEVLWMPLSVLADQPLRPRALIPLLQPGAHGAQVYVGTLD